MGAAPVHPHDQRGEWRDPLHRGTGQPPRGGVAPHRPRGGRRGPSTLGRPRRLHRPRRRRNIAVTQLGRPYRRWSRGGRTAPRNRQPEPFRRPQPPCPSSAAAAARPSRSCPEHRDLWRRVQRSDAQPASTVGLGPCQRTDRRTPRPRHRVDPSRPIREPVGPLGQPFGSPHGATPGHRDRRCGPPSRERAPGLGLGSIPPERRRVRRLGLGVLRGTRLGSRHDPRRVRPAHRLSQPRATRPFSARNAIVWLTAASAAIARNDFPSAAASHPTKSDRRPSRR